MPTTAHRTKASELPDTTFASAADVELGLAPVDPAVPVGVPPPTPCVPVVPVAPIVPVAVSDGPAVTPTPEVPEAPVLREAVEKVVFRLIGIPVPPDEAAVPARVVVKSVGLTMVAFPDGPATMMAVVTDIELVVEEEDIDAVVEPPVRENVPL